VVLSAVALAGLAALAIGTLWSSLGPPAETASGRGATTDATGTGGPSGSSGAGPAITGTISLARDLTGRVRGGETLFIVARKGARASGPPFAVKRIVGPHFPLQYRLGPEDVMMAGSPFEGPFHVTAHLSRRGAAGPVARGDLEGEHPGEVQVGARGVDIVIARVR
jgi:hypothetical protein